MRAMLAGAIVVLGLTGCAQTQSDPTPSPTIPSASPSPAVPDEYPQCSGHAHDRGPSDYQCDETGTRAHRDQRWG